MKDNKGFTLIELIVSIAILGLIMASVTTVIAYVSRTFVRGSADANMQRESQMVMNQIENLIVDTNGGVSYDDSVADVKSLKLYRAEDDGAGSTLYTEEVIAWSALTEEILYSKYNVKYNAITDDYTRDTTIYEDQLLAQYISDFEVNIDDFVTEYTKDGIPIDIVRSVIIKMGCKDSSGNVTYSTSPVITLRNRMMKSNSPTLIFENTPTQTDTLAVYMSSYDALAVETIRQPVQNGATVVNPGETYKLYVMVNDANDVNAYVNWTLEGSSSSSSVNADGMLSVAADETGGLLTVIATYKDNPNKQAKALLKVN